MENTTNYEETRKILEDNINRILNEKRQTPRWLSLKIKKNAWYITRMLEGKHNPSLEVLCKIAEVLRVSVADLFTKKEG